MVAAVVKVLVLAWQRVAKVLLEAVVTLHPTISGYQLAIHQVIRHRVG